MPAMTFVVKSHILAAAMEMLDMVDLNEIPSCSLFPGLQDRWME